MNILFIVFIMAFINISESDTTRESPINNVMDSGEKTHKVFNNNNKPPLKIAIIDTGLDINLYTGHIPLCPTGHFNASIAITPDLKVNRRDPRASQVGIDTVGHGTIVANIIAEGIGVDNNMCLLIYKFHNPKLTGKQETGSLVYSLYMAIKNRADIINLSVSGPYYSEQERKLLKIASKYGIKVFIAAGNNSKNLDWNCNTYPVCHKKKNKKLITVGKHLPSLSNYGKIIDICLDDTNIYSTARGTSFSTPRAVNDYLKLERKYSARNTVGIQWAWSNYLQKNVCKTAKRK